MPATPAAPTGSTQTTDKPKVNPDETNAEKFVRLAELRAGNAIESIRKLSLLGNKSQYEYTDEQVLKIESALTESVKACMSSLRNGKPSQSSFKL